MYIDYNLKFIDEAEALSVLYRMEGVVEANEELSTEAVEGYEVPNFKNIDTMGILYNNDAIVDTEDNIITPATTKTGWHVNVRVCNDEDSTILEQYKINVLTPNRVWG